ncbi:autophagy-related protein 13a isoform X1 [Rhodamnia argentea]|uniref:Autophagy-related protein 13a isoform X1 n=1 Tax=Rhodamnia argentea TaxID=178133 RepID=A0A8B8PZH9_9MYRT|nr:autophagy-related protein 13a isoform X1 [Rhodamnia argentea]XP_030539687.1 autophagy-related protein 13a isoform X1 [Rhodamnia argentea]XP_030539688.1 autophagy-related protein 13a isoform X1 [Rhodamnia argentea]XP_048127917.1 autophagy-related protein 13a isoform X1 [Rhodamnia argentea]
MDQIVSQFLLKSLHIILDSRIPSLHPNDQRSGHRTSVSRARKNDKWFNLVLGDRPAALENLNFWHRNLMDPMIIDVILVDEGSNSSSVDAYSAMKASVETVIERWVVHYESSRVTPNINDSSLHKKIYKKLIVLLRSLYSQMRLLPAYRIFRQLSSSGQTYNLDLIYKVSTFSNPFSRAEEEMMKEYTFAPVEASSGRFSVAVSYRKTLSDFNLEPATSLFPRIITDYVGSPATDPLRSFPSFDKGVRATSFSLRGARPPSSAPFQRPHSWTSGFHRPAPFTQGHSLGGSPPTYCTYGSPSPPTDMYSQRAQSYRSTSQRVNSYEECQLSPPFSPSPSPSPPTYFSSGSVGRNRGRSETAPMTIPHPTASGNARYLSPNFSDPNRHSLPPLSPRHTRLDPSSQESPSGIRSFRKQESLRSGELHNHYVNQKVTKDGRDDSGRFSGLLSSSGSPRIGFSRSSSRLSFQDDLDDGDFSCPFDVDDVDPPASNAVDGREGSELTSSSPMGAKSQDAAVGVLVHMLRTASPLEQNSSCYSAQSLNTEQEGGVATASGFFMPRKTTDALEELRSYREMKNLLRSKSGAHVLTKEEA